MEDDFDSYNHGDSDNNASLDRFINMLKANDSYFFDVEDFETIIDYYLDKSDMFKAKKVIKMSLLQHPSSVVLKLKEAQFLAATHQPHKALEILYALELLEPFNAEIYTVKATIHSQLRQHAKAIENFYKALKLVGEESEKINLKINIAFEHENLNQYDKAITILKKILIENPHNETVMYELAFCYSLSNSNHGSIQFFKAFLEEHPYSFLAWFNLGVAYNQSGLYEKAIDAYDFSIVIKEDFASAYFNKANSLALLQCYEKAIATYQETFTYEEPDATIYYYIGECYEKLENTALAIKNYYKATKLDPFYADAWAGMAVMNEGQDKNQSALFYIKKALELENNNSEYWYIYGDILAKTELYEEALIAYNKVVEYDETNEDIWLDKAELFKNSVGLEKGTITLYEGIEKQPENFLIYARLVAYLLMEGKINEAEQCLIVLLTNDKEKVSELATYYPETINFPTIVELLNKFK